FCHVASFVPCAHVPLLLVLLVPFFFKAPPTPEIYTLSLHDALPISARGRHADRQPRRPVAAGAGDLARRGRDLRRGHSAHAPAADRKSTRLNSSHVKISYAVFCLKKKKKHKSETKTRDARQWQTAED